MKSKDLTVKRPNALKTKGGVKGRRMVRARRRWRVDIINENTLTRAWSIRLSGVRIWLAAALVPAALVSLIAVIFLFTPLASLLPGRLSGDMRTRYLDTAMRIDSLEHAAAASNAYASNLIAILTDSVADEIPPRTAAGETAAADTLVEATEAERSFVRKFEERERFNLSVLSPIAAEGMIFEAPYAGDAPGAPVAAVYRGTVISAGPAHDGTFTVVVQHPNDFISIYSRLEEIYVDTGSKISAAQRLGKSTTGAPAVFELWHSGTRLDPELYISNQKSTNI